MQDADAGDGDKAFIFLPAPASASCLLSIPIRVVTQKVIQFLARLH
jgi:hypothetical protein